jgi:hypothetical protein
MDAFDTLFSPLPLPPRIKSGAGSSRKGRGNS